MSARRLAAALVAASSMAALGAFAAGTSVVSDTLASGSTAVAGCDQAPAWTYEYIKNSSDLVVQVKVSTISSLCQGGQLTVALAPSGSQGSALLSGCTTECSATIDLTQSLTPSAVDGVTAMVVGP